jgi:signal transduction histidine kinase
MQYKDDGRGIDKAIIDNIFEPFFTSTRTEGSGLGLYICHSIVTQDLSGTIVCHSIKNQGVTFSIKFPLEVEPTPHLELNSVEG